MLPGLRRQLLSDQYPLPLVRGAESRLRKIDCELWDPERVVPSGVRGEYTTKAGSVAQAGHGGVGKARNIDSAVIGSGEALELTDRFTAGETSGRPQLRIRHEGSKLVIEALVPGPWRLVSTDGRGDRRLEHGPAVIPCWVMG